MASRSYTGRRRRGSPESVDRVLDAAARLIRDDAFHTATMEELAAAAGVSRATVFNRFGSKLGVLQALFRRGMEGPEMQAIIDALAIEDPDAALEAVIEAASAIWEAYGEVHLQLQAVGTLEPEATTLVDQQRGQQRRDRRAGPTAGQGGPAPLRDQPDSSSGDAAHADESRVVRLVEARLRALAASDP